MKDIILTLNKALEIAKDDTHGYDQEYRNGPDFDCSSFIGTVLEFGGFDVSPKSWTGNLRKQLLDNGFKVIPVNSPRRAGDIFLTEGRHVVMCVDEDTIVHAAINEKGGITGGQKGDQTGNEICVTNFYTPSYKWQYHFRHDYTIPSANYFDKNCCGKYMVVDTTWLNVRENAGTQFDVVRVIPWGNLVECTGYYNLVGTTKWLYCDGFYKNQPFSGYISSKYLGKVTNILSETKRYKVVKTPWLNVREGVGTNTKFVTAIPLNKVVDYIGEEGYFNGTRWIKISFDTNKKTYIGYCSTKYLEKI